MTYKEFFGQIVILKNAGLRFTPQLTPEFKISMKTIWYPYFRQYSIQVFQKTIIQYIAQNSNYPTIADLLKIIKEQTDDSLSIDEIHSLIHKCFGKNMQQCKKIMPLDLFETIKNLGGIYYLGMLSEKDFMFFLEHTLYPAYKTKYNIKYNLLEHKG